MAIQTASAHRGSAPTGVLLAAGAGHRFGMPKVCAENGAWAATAIRALHSGGCHRVLAVLGAAPSIQLDGAESVVAADWSLGLSRSIAAGLDRVEGDTVVTLVDTPDVSADCVRRLISAGQQAESGTARAVYRGRVGHPVYVAARCRLPLLQALLEVADRDADRGLGPHLPAGTLLVECGDIATGSDVDRPDELWWMW